MDVTPMWIVTPQIRDTSMKPFRASGFAAVQETCRIPFNFNTCHCNTPFLVAMTSLLEPMPGLEQSPPL